MNAREAELERENAIMRQCLETIVRDYAENGGDLLRLMFQDRARDYANLAGFAMARLDNPEYAP